MNDSYSKLAFLHRVKERKTPSLSAQASFAPFSLKVAWSGKSLIVTCIDPNCKMSQDIICSVQNVLRWSYYNTMTSNDHYMSKASACKGDN